MVKRRFYIGQQLEGKIVECVFRDGTGNMVMFTDGTYKVYK